MSNKQQFYTRLYFRNPEAIADSFNSFYIESESHETLEKDVIQFYMRNRNIFAHTTLKGFHTTHYDKSNGLFLRIESKLDIKHPYTPTYVF